MGLSGYLCQKLASQIVLFCIALRKFAPPHMSYPRKLPKVLLHTVKLRLWFEVWPRHWLNVGLASRKLLKAVMDQPVLVHADFPPGVVGEREPPHWLLMLQKVKSLYFSMKCAGNPAVKLANSVLGRWNN